jgi:hypothetical protein
VNKGAICDLYRSLHTAAYALNPSLDLSQYAPKSSTPGEGFFKGIMPSIAQTPDG